MGMLQELVTRLAIPGMPEWTGLVGLLLLLLVGIAYLLMPFSVFGLKGRLESIEAQLDELQAELRALNLRPPGAGARALSDDWVEPPAAAGRMAPAREGRSSPPIPPPAAWPESQARGTRAEPRLDWPKRG